MALAAFRNFRFAFVLALATVPGLASALPSAASAAPARGLDQVRIHADYHDGEFGKVIKELEAFRKSGRACTRAESLFLEKHLAVVYAANPDTRELGRYHMFRLLNLAPGSDLLDMFVGEEVDAVFGKVRKEHGLRAALAKAPALAPRPAAPSRARPVQAAVRKARPAPIPESGPADAPASGPAWKEPGLWIGGGAALAVVAFTFFYAGSDQAPAGKTYVVPASVSP